MTHGYKISCNVCVCLGGVGEQVVRDYWISQAFLGKWRMILILIYLPPSFTTTETCHRRHSIRPTLSVTQMVCTMGHISCIESITNFQIPDTRKKWRPQKTWSECVKTEVNMWPSWRWPTWQEMQGEPVLYIVWCCQPHRMGYGQHLYLKRIWMDGMCLCMKINIRANMAWFLIWNISIHLKRKSISEYETLSTTSALFTLGCMLLSSDFTDAY